MDTVKSATAGSPSLLRRVNSAAVLRVVRQGKAVSRAEIARLTGLSVPTVNGVVEDLLLAGYLQEDIAQHGDRARRRGPRPRLVHFRANVGHVLGLDIGANKVLAIVSDLDGEATGSDRRTVAAAADANEVLEVAAAAVRAALRRAKVSANELLSAAVGTPGVVELPMGRVTLAPQLPGWEGLPLADRVAQWLGRPVLAVNEVHLSLLAERWRGAIQGVDDALYVQVGIGIGAGILMGKQLYRGSTGAAGEIGYLPLINCAALLPQGVGQFEYSAGGRAFARLGSRAAAGPHGSVLRELAGGDPASVDAAMVFSAASRGDPTAGRILNKIVGRLARGIAAAVALLNPAVVVVGGGLSQAGDMLLAPLEDKVRGLVPMPPRFVLSALGDEAVALGAVRAALDTVDDDLLALAREAL